MKTTLIIAAAAIAAIVFSEARCALGSHSESTSARPGPEECLSPAALALSPDGNTLFIACATANRILFFDTAARQVKDTLTVPVSPSGLVASREGLRLYVTCASPTSVVAVIDVAEKRIIAQIPAGHTAMSPVLSRDEQRLYVCNRFDHEVAVIDLAQQQTVHRIAVAREPVAAALTPDGDYLLVANHLPPARGHSIPGFVSVIATASGQVVKEMGIFPGSGLLRGIAVSPDGRFAAVTHVMARYYLPASEVEQGRINANAVSFFDLKRMQWLWLVYLDQETRGAANPWAVAWTPDGQFVVTTHAGSHEVTLVDAPRWPQKPVRTVRRIALPGKGPRALALAGSRLYVAHYFSDNLSLLDLAAPESEPLAVALGPETTPALARYGELLFNDAGLCHQQWQSCASCHDADARVDGLNWDLLNDGEGNPKNAKSLVWAHRTPPAMALGVRASAAVAVRAGIRHILFTSQPEEVAQAIDAYLKSLEPVPSPFLVNGALSPAAQEGQRLFHDEGVRCAQCHPPPWFTDLQRHDVGTRTSKDHGSARFDTPTLVELYRTAPYLHSGYAATVREVLTQFNQGDRHGRTSHLSEAEISALCAYLLSL